VKFATILPIRPTYNESSTATSKRVPTGNVFVVTA
jgi:hypothetical protein